MKKLLVISGKGGTGKTTVSSALIHLFQAQAFADCDVDAPNLHLMQRMSSPPVESDFYGGMKAVVDPLRCIGCGICEQQCRFHAIHVQSVGSSDISQPAGPSDISQSVGPSALRRAAVSEYACEGCGVCELVCPRKAISLVPDKAGALRLYRDTAVFSTAELKMGRGNSGKLVMEVKKNLYRNAGNAELAILDGSPGVGCPVMAAVSGVNLALIVTEPSLSGKSDLERLAKTLKNCGVRAAVCINRYDIHPKISRLVEERSHELGLAVVGKIPYDSQASGCVNRGESLVELPSSPAGAALRELYQKIRLLLQDEKHNLHSL